MLPGGYRNYFGSASSLETIARHPARKVSDADLASALVSRGEALNGPHPNHTDTAHRPTTPQLRTAQTATDDLVPVPFERTAHCVRCRGTPDHRTEEIRHNH
jgi:hypothetical protein